MECECCGGQMQWRCTDNNTRIAKYKCLCCGNIQFKLTEEPEPLNISPKYYYRNHDKWIVRRKHHGEHKYVGTFANLETAKMVVREMNLCDWDMSCVPHIFDVLNIKRVNQTWVCVA